MNSGKRLSKYIENKGFTKKKFCEEHSFDYNNMTVILAGNRNLGINVLNQLHLALPKLNVHWLLYGEGPEEVVFEEMHVLNEPRSHYGPESPEFKKQLLEALEDIEVQKKIYEKFRPKK